jgi:hypothetical protein
MLSESCIGKQVPDGPEGEQVVLQLQREGPINQLQSEDPSSLASRFVTEKKRPGKKTDPVNGNSWPDVRMKKESRII